MRLNMHILAEHFRREEVLDSHIPDTTVLDLKNIRKYTPEKKPDWENYVYLIDGEIRQKDWFAGWDPWSDDKHMIFLNTQDIPEAWREEQWILLKTGTCASEVLERIAGVFEWFQEWEERLLRAQIAGTTLKGVLRIAAEAVPNPIGLFDSSTSCLGWAGELPEKRDALWELAVGEKVTFSSEMYQLYKKLGILEEVEGRKAAAIYRLGDETWPDFMNANIYDAKGKTRLGNLGTTALNAPMTAGQLAVFDYLASYLSPILERYHQTLYDARKQNFINCLDRKPVSKEYFWNRMSAGGVSDKRRLHILYIRQLTGDGEGLYSLEALETRLQRGFLEQKNIFVSYHNGIAVFACDLDSSEKMDAWIGHFRKLAGEVQFCIGISEMFDSIEEIPDGYKQAEIAVGYALNKKKNGAVRFRECIYKYAACKITEDLSIKAICHPKIYEIYLYDQEHRTSYMETLHAYLESSCNVSKTAGRLYLHRNTVNYRLEKMRELFGDKFIEESPGDMLFSLKILMN